MKTMIDQYLDIALKHDAIFDFLAGDSAFKINSDPRDKNSEHAYGASIAAYNKRAIQMPELKEKFEKAIIDKISSSNCSLYDIYLAFNIVLEQIRYERRYSESMHIDEAQIKQILNSKISELKNELSSLKYDKAKDYQNGAYEYMVTENERLAEFTGRHIL